MGKDLEVQGVDLFLKLQDYKKNTTIVICLPLDFISSNWDICGPLS